MVSGWGDDAPAQQEWPEVAQPSQPPSAPQMTPPNIIRAAGGMVPSKGLDSPLGRVMARMLVCACNSLTAAGRPVCDCCFGHTASVPTMDVYCNCDCITDPAYAQLGGGQAWVRLVRIDTLSRDLDVARCAPMQLQAIVEVGVFRCWPSPSGDAADGSAPSCEDRTTAAMGLVTDTQLLWMSGYCCNTNTPPGAAGFNGEAWINDWEIQPYVSQPISPQGGCAGTTVMSYVRGVLPGVPDLALIANQGP